MTNKVRCIRGVWPSLSLSSYAGGVLTLSAGVGSDKRGTQGGRLAPSLLRKGEYVQTWMLASPLLCEKRMEGTTTPVMTEYCTHSEGVFAVYVRVPIPALFRWGRLGNS